MAINKVAYGSSTLIDLTNDTVTSATLLDGYQAHDKSGTIISGSIADNGAKNYTISSVDDLIYIDEGYHNGNGTIQLSATEKTNLIASNIKKGVTILGVTGTYEPKNINISVSSSYSTYAGSIDYIIDGNTSTYWWTDGAQSRGKYVLFTFSEAVTLNSVRVQTTGSNTDYICSGTQLQTSSNGSSWTSVSYFPGSKDSTITVNESNVQYVRFYVSTASSNWLYINEVTFDYTA